MVKVSVVIPVYNVEKYLIACLESVIHQTLRDIEIICVDDGSTDSCGKILDDYAEKDPRIQVIHKENGGYGKAMNIGMDAATGKYFAILESDDIIRPQMYERLYDLAEKYELDIIKADFCRFIVNEGVIKETPDNCVSDPSMYGVILDGKTDYKNILLKAPLYTWSGIYRLDFLRQNSIRHNETPGASYQDNGFWFQTMCSAERVYFLNEQFYMLRRDNPNSSFLSKGKVYCVRDEYDFILRYLKKRPDLYKRLISLYWPIRFGAYMFTYKRIAPKYKLEFLEHTKIVFQEAQNANQLIQNEFYKSKWNDLQEILRSPQKYHRRYLAETSNKNIFLKAWNRWCWCCKDHGLKYTIFYTFKRIKNKIFCSKNMQLLQEIKQLTRYHDRQLRELKKISSMLIQQEEYLKALLSVREKTSSAILHVEDQLDKTTSYVTRNTRLLKEIKQHSLPIEQELLYAHIFNQYIINSSWLYDTAFAPGRAAVGYNYLYVTYRCLDEFKPKNILDIGLGQSTKMFTQYIGHNPGAFHIVVEHDQEWIDFFKNKQELSSATTIQKCDITLIDFEGEKGVRAYKGFDRVIANKKFDFISIDAPISYDMEVYARIDILPFLTECLAENFIILLDDYQRKAEQHTAKLIRTKLTENNIPFVEGVYEGQTTLLMICSENCKFFTSL